MEHTTNKVPLETAKALALRQAQAITDFDAKDEIARVTGDNQKRLQRLDLGDTINNSSDPKAVIDYVAAHTSQTKGMLAQYAMVAKFNVESGFGPLLQEQCLSFTQNRTLAYIRVTLKAEGVPIEARIAAMLDSVERNNGVFKEDADYRKAVGILPPPNSVENIIERAKEDPVFRASLVKQGMFVTPKPEAETGLGYHRAAPSDPLILRVASVTTQMTVIKEAAFEAEGEVSPVLVDAARGWRADCDAIIDLAEMRRDL